MVGIDWRSVLYTGSKEKKPIRHPGSVRGHVLSLGWHSLGKKGSWLSNGRPGFANRATRTALIINLLTTISKLPLSRILAHNLTYKLF